MFPLKAFYWGQKGARENFSLQIRNIVEHGYGSLGETPVLLGECGIPMDMKFVEAVIMFIPSIHLQFCIVAKARLSRRTISNGRCV